MPNADRAFIDFRKLSRYILDPNHPVGGHKAAVFRSALGLTLEDASALSDLILQAASSGEARLGRLDEFGQRYVIDFRVSTAIGSAWLRAAWIVRSGEDFPRLTTCFVLEK
jgi:hypothetical protein